MGQFEGDGGGDADPWAGACRRLPTEKPLPPQPRFPRLKEPMAVKPNQARN